MTSQAEKDELQKTFQSLDKDSNGVLTKEELIEGDYSDSFSINLLQAIKKSLLIRRMLNSKSKRSLKKLILIIQAISTLQVSLFRTKTA